MKKTKEYLDISEIEDIKNISAEDSALIRDKDIKISLTPAFCILTIIFSVLVSIGVYFIKKDMLFASQVFLLVPLLVYISAVDIKLHLAPNWVAYIIIGVGIPSIVMDFVCADYSDLLWNRLFGMLCGFILLFIATLVTGGGVGSADIKIMTALGLVLGFSGVFVSQIVGMLIATVVGCVLMLNKKATKKTRLALLPYLSIGAIVAMLLPNGIIF